MSNISLLIAMLLLLSSPFIGNVVNAKLARSYSLVASGFCLVAMFLATLFYLPDLNQPFQLQPLLVLLITYVAVALSSLSRCRARTFGTILALSALTIMLSLFTEPRILVLLWLALNALAWLETRQYCPRAASLFVAYIGAANALICTGLLLGAKGVLLVVVALGLCIREAVFPFQSWLVSFVEELPMGLVAVFIAPQVGVVFHFRILAHQLPELYHQEIAMLGVLTALFGAALATVQPKLRRVLAYLFISQSGLVAFGLENQSGVAQKGALACWFIVALAGSTFAMLIESIESRHGCRVDLTKVSGNFEDTPRLATGFLITGLAMVGLPGTLGLVSEDLLVQGSVTEFPVLGLTLIVATALNAITVVKALFTIFGGASASVCRIDLENREHFALTLVLIPIFLFGIYPQLLLDCL